MATETAPSAPPNPFWDYSLALYARPGVAKTCLRLQDRHGLDVNLLLFCCWAASRGQRLAAPDLEVLMAAVADWQAQVLVPMRGLRRWLKGRAAGGQATRDAALGAAAGLHDRIKTQELDAERVEQDLLYQALPLADGKPDPDAAAANLTVYLQACGLTLDSDDQDDLTALLA